MNKINPIFDRFKTTIADAGVDLSCDSSKFNKGIEEAKTKVDQFGNTIVDLSNTTSKEIKKMAASFASVDLSKGFAKTRKELQGSILGLFNDAKKMIQEGNTSGAFNIKMQTEMDKFSKYTQGTDMRTTATDTEINKLLATRQRLLSALSSEQDKVHNKEVTALRKVFEAEEKVRLAVENTNKSREKSSQLISNQYGAIEVLGAGMNAIRTSSSNFMANITKTAVRIRILGGFVGGIVKAFGELYDTAASYEEAINLYRTALGSFAEEADAWANRISTALYLDPKQVMQYTGALYNLVQGLGVSEEAAYKMATNLTQLSYDMSSYLNIDVQSAYDKIQSAITGQSRAVASAGVALQQAALQEKLYNLGINESIKNLSQAEKTYLRYIQIMDSTKNMQMDLGKTIITPENALRTVRAQFVLFARALGQVVIPIVMTAIPYIMALTRMLTTLANRLASLTGYKVADIDYSGLDTAADKIGKVGKNLDGVGTSAKAAKDAVTRTLAPFDELNVVESKSKTGGSGGVGSGGGGAGILSDLEKYIDGYDMLGKLTKSFESKVDEAEQKIKKLIPVLKAIGLAFVGWKLADMVVKANKLITSLVDLTKSGGVLGSVIKTVASRFADGYKYAKYFGESGLTAVLSGTRNLLGPFGKLVTSVGTVVASFTGSFNIMKEWDMTSSNLAARLLGSTGLVAALTAVAAVFVGPMAAGITIIAGITGALAGASVALENYYMKEKLQEGYNELFDQQGVSIESVMDIIDDGLGHISEHANVMNTLLSGTDQASQSFENAKKSLNDYNDALINGNIHYSSRKEMINGIKEKMADYKTTADEVFNNEKNTHLEIINNLKEQGLITEDEYNKRKKTIEDFYTTQKLLNSEYSDQLTELMIKRQSGTISEKEYQAQLQKLKDEYAGLKTVNDDATVSAEAYLQAINGKINFEDPEKLRDVIAETKQKRKEYIDTENESYEKQKEWMKNQRDEASTTMAKLIEVYGSEQAAREKSNGLYDEASAKYDTMVKNLEDAETAHNNNITQINSTFKNFLATSLAELYANGQDANKEFSSVIKDINGEMGSIGKDVNISDSVTDFFGKYASQMETDGKKFSDTQVGKFKKYGIDISDTYGDNIISEWSKKKEEVLTSYTVDYKPLWDKSKKGGETTGVNYSAGVSKGITDTKKDVSDAANELCLNTDKAVTTKWDINSPSKVSARYGAYYAEGIAQGISSQSSAVFKAIDSMLTSVNKKMSDTQLKLNINTSVESSFNSILKKLQTFCTNWRNAVNSLVSGMKSTMNSINIDKNGKVTYNSMPSVTVKKFANGGFPTKGDLFYANEEGVPEYITSIGNRPVVANQDQTVAALTNAILTGMSQIPTGSTQPSTIVVQIGNKTVYEGQGEYQNRQTDRYGTTYVKI